MTQKTQPLRIEYRLDSYGDKENHSHLEAIRWSDELDVRWHDCEGKSQISLQQMVSNGIAIHVHIKCVPEDYEYPHPELFGTDWLYVRPHKADNKEISDKLYDMEEAHSNACRAFEHRLAGTSYRNLSYREAIEVLLYLKDEGIVFPDSLINRIAVYIEEEEKATPKASEWLASKYSEELVNVKSLSRYMDKMRGK